MKEVNLISLVDTKNKVKREIYDSYINMLGIEIRDYEVDTIESLLKYLYNEMELCSHYYVGYKIPQIGKEFDLVRLGTDSIINIELKSEASFEKMEEQLIKNKYYLESLGLQMFLFSFNEETKNLYFLNEENRIEESSFEKLQKCILEQTLSYENLDSLFKPSNYLVSPFNNTNKFLCNNYFLTNQQEEFKRKIIKDLVDKNYYFESITGKAGTGKTLLIYDLAKTFKDRGLKVTIIHCGILNEGQSLLNNKGWDIKEIKYYKNCLKEEIDIIILDEAQRIRPNQLEEITNFIYKHKKKCIISYDHNQCINKSEIINYKKILKLLEEINTRNSELTSKIRTNKEIASFIMNLFDLKNSSKTSINYHNIDVLYFENEKSAKRYISGMSDEGWKSINYTGSQFNPVYSDLYQIPYNITAHRVIGQEFDDVMAVIDGHFYFDKDYELNCGAVEGGPHEYIMTKMLYQILTRTREKLKIIVIKNEPVFSYILSILNGNIKNRLRIEIEA